MLQLSGYIVVTIDLIVLITACTSAGYVFRDYDTANGHRPFLVGYMCVACLMVFSAISAFYGWPAYTRAISRIAQAGTLVATLIWAGRKR